MGSLTPLSAASAGYGGVAGEVFAKHGRSQQPESAQLCAALAAIMEVIEAQALKPTPIVLFAATMASLERAQDDNSFQVHLPDLAARLYCYREDAGLAPAAWSSRQAPRTVDLQVLVIWLARAASRC